MLKRRLAVILMLSVLLCVSIMPSSVFAEETQRYVDMDKSDVMSDLSGSMINGEVFDKNNYPAKKNGKIDIINLLEFGYAKTMNAQYGLYVYLYNPKQIEFISTNFSNRILIGFTNGENSCDDYTKYAMQFVSKSVDNLFYKFRIVLPDPIHSTLNPDSRKYCISGIELMETKDNIATDYKIACTYEYTGFGATFGDTPESTLRCRVKGLEVLELDVHSLEYKTQAKTNNHLHSVCFSVPNKAIKEYGALTKVECEWYEFETQPIIVTWNTPNGLHGQNYYNRLKPYVGKKADGNAPEFGTDWRFAGTQINPYDRYDWCYNPDKGAGGFGKTKYNSSMDIIYYLFNSGNVNPMTYDISADNLMSYIYHYDKSYEKGKIPIKSGRISEDLFTNSIKAGRTRGYNRVTIDSKGSDNLFTTTNDNWWNKLWGTHTEIGGSVKPLESVSSIDYSDADFMNKYKLNQRSCNTLKNEVASAKARDKTTYIMRIGVTDYSSEPIHFSNIETGGYVAKETVFLDFDIITLTFEREGNEVVMPVVSNPIDITGDVTHPEIPERGIDKIIKIILMIVALVLLIVLLWPMLPHIINLIVWIIMLPFNLIKMLINSFKKKE